MFPPPLNPNVTIAPPVTLNPTAVQDALRMTKEGFGSVQNKFWNMEQEITELRSQIRELNHRVTLLRRAIPAELIAAVEVADELTGQAPV